MKLSEDFAFRARREINTDEPTVDCLQASLLLVTAFTAAGKGKKAYMLLSESSTSLVGTVLTHIYSHCGRYGNGA